AGCAHGHMVWIGWSARYAEGDRGAHQSRTGGHRQAAGVPGQARQARPCGGLQARRRVHLVHGGRHQEMAGAHSRDGNSSGRLGRSSTEMASKAAAKKPKILTWPNGKKVAVSVT